MIEKSTCKKRTKKRTGKRSDAIIDLNKLLLLLLLLQTNLTNQTKPNQNLMHFKYSIHLLELVSLGINQPGSA
jgi:hypothetical protein